MVSSPLIEQVMLIGQDEKQLGALVVLREQMLIGWAQEKGFPLLDEWSLSPGEEKLRSYLRSELNRLLGGRQGSRPEERVIGVALVKPFTLENGMLTQTLKQRRNLISERDQSSIDAIYGR